MRHRRHYTLEEASAQLPWVSEQLGRLRSARDRLGDVDARQALTGSAPGNGGGAAGRDVGEAYVDLRAAVGELDERDIIVRDVSRGLIDFPSLHEGHEVYLCWVDGEPAIGFWHELDAGFTGRQPL